MWCLRLVLLSLILTVLAGCGDAPPPPLTPLEKRLVRIGAELGRVGYEVDMRRVRVERRNPAIGVESTPQDWLTTTPAEEAGRMHVWTRLMGGADSGPYDQGVAGYFAPWRDAIVLFDRGSGADLDHDELIAHEAMHVRQHRQRAIFSRSWHRTRRTSEGEAILQCLIEGEAEVGALAFRLARRKSSLAAASPEAIDRGVDQGTTGASALLPYVYGRRFVLRTLRDRGTAGVDDLYKTPPPSTEQMMHPEKFGIDAPTPVVWPAGILPDAALIHEDTLGELRIQQWLAWFYGRTPSVVGSTGWDGDAVRVYRNKDGSLTSVWVTIWDRPQDAEEFHELALAVSGARGEARAIFERTGRLVLAVAGDDPKTVDSVLAHAQRLFPSPEVVAEDAASTARIAARWEEHHRPAGVRAGVHWDLPMLGVRVPVPRFWRAGLAGGVDVLQRAPHDVGPVAEIGASTRAMGRPSTTQDVRTLLERLNAEAPGERVLSINEVDLGGRPAILAERAIAYRSGWYPVRTLNLYIPDGNDLLIIEAWVHDDARDLAWEDARQALLGVRFVEPKKR